MRLTNDLRKSWLRMVFDERKGVIDEAVQTIIKVLGWLYDATYSAEEQQQMNALPDGCLPTAWYGREPCDMGALEGDAELATALEQAVYKWEFLDETTFKAIHLEFSSYYTNPLLRFRRSDTEPQEYRVWDKHATCSFTPEVRHPDVLLRHRDSIVSAVQALNNFKEALDQLWEAAKAATSTNKLKLMVPELAHLVEELEATASGKGGGKSTALVKQVPCEVVETLGLKCER